MGDVLSIAYFDQIKHSPCMDYAILNFDWLRTALRQKDYIFLEEKSYTVPCMSHK